MNRAARIRTHCRGADPILRRVAWSWCVVCLVAPGVLATTLDDARALHLAGNTDAALEAYRVVAAGDTPPADRARALNNRCVLLQSRSRYDEAVADCLGALELRRGEGDDRGTARTLNNLGLAWQNVGRFDAARNAYDEALAVNLRRRDDESRAVNLANLATLETLAERYGDALARLAEVRALADRSNDAPWATRQRVLADINAGVVLEKLAAYRDALVLYRAVLDGPLPLDDRQRATLNANVGVIYRNLGDPYAALDAFEKARATFRDAGDVSGEANAWLNVGLVRQVNLDDPSGASLALETAIDLARRTGDTPQLLAGLVQSGRLALAVGEAADAVAFFDEALALAVDSGAREGEWSALEGLGRVAIAAGDDDVAERRFARAIDLLESSRAAIDDRSLRQAFFSDKRAVYAAMVALLVRRHAVDPRQGADRRALGYAQRARARELAEALGGRHDSGTLSPDAATHSVAPDTLALYFFIADRQVIGWAIDTTGIESFVAGDADALGDDVAAVHGRLAAGAAPAPATLARLADALVAPVGERLAGRRRLTIVPDAFLNDLPFEWLPVRTAGQTALVDRFELTYAPTLNGGSAGPPGGPDYEIKLAGFAGYVGRPAGEHPAASTIRRFALPPLAHSDRELAAVSRLVPQPQRLFRDAAATEASFRQAVAEGAALVHVASHTIIDAEARRGSAIVLAPDGRDDGLLYPDELAALDYRAGLTVLAACRTAFDADAPGAEIGTLTGALLAAGSSSVVATLWDVGDEATAAFMTQFYARLARGMPPARALTDTKRALREHPAWRRTGAWSAYVLYGDAPPLYERPTIRWHWLALGLLAAAGSVYLRRKGTVGRGLTGS